jgi:hypothetical protein
MIIIPIFFILGIVLFIKTIGFLFLYCILNGFIFVSHT